MDHLKGKKTFLKKEMGYTTPSQNSSGDHGLSYGQNGFYLAHRSHITIPSYLLMRLPT